MKTKYLMTIISIILIGFTGCEKSSSETKIEKVLRPVKYITVQANNKGQVRTFSGISKAQYESMLSFRVSGIIKNINVKVGDILKSKDLIASVDKLPFKLQEQKERALLSQIQADRRNNESKYQRIKELYENSNASKSDLDSARALVESSRAQVNSQKHSLKLAQLNLEYTSLKTKNNCSVSEVLKEINENVAAGESIVGVACGKVNEVKISIPENFINSIEKGMSAKIKFDSIPNKEFNAKVTELSVSSSATTTFPVILAMSDTKNSKIRSGMAAEVTFNFHNNADKNNLALYLPSISVGQDVDGPYVFVVKPTKTAHEGLIKKQTVRIGELTSLGIEILEGVQSGDKIVTAGMTTIRDGLIVKAE